MNDPGFCSYFTRHMPIELRERLHRLVNQRNAANGTGPRHTLEEIVNEALERGAVDLEGDQMKRLDAQTCQRCHKVFSAPIPLYFCPTCEGVLQEPTTNRVEKPRWAK